ncbi:MAG TPA: hypothetical protein DIW47_07070 [Bacteroidetes bacterium]|nr:hypothetical protein [Bacteroidota bacterium]
MKQKFIPLVLIALLFVSCSDSRGLLDLFSKGPENLSLKKDFTLLEVEGDYSLLVPKYMKEDKSLHPDASLAYKHEVKEVAVLVIDENKSELIGSLALLDGYTDSASFIENYAKVQMNMISANLGFPEMGEPVLKKIGELDAAQVWLEGQIEEAPVVYFLSCVDAGEKVYMVMSYTSKEKKTKFEDTFRKIADSFLLISPVID